MGKEGLIACMLLLGAAGCGNDEYCGYPPEWSIRVTDDPAPLTEQTGEPVARLDILKTNRCKASLELDEFYVNLDTPDYSSGKSTRAVNPANLLLMTLVDANDNGALDAGEALVFDEGPYGVVPPDVEWNVWLMLRSGTGGSGMAKDSLLSR